MSIVVQKFGGTSVADINRIILVTQTVIKELNNNNQVVVVVSAMAGVTNTLMNYCREISKLTDPYDIKITDFVLSNGENISSGLTALALRQKGIKSIPLQGWQIPILTTEQSSKALITWINTKAIKNYLDNGYTPVICGFQGIDTNNYITTLGRGGSDITATAIAGALQACCDIYTDVSGVYSCDPRIVPQASKITTIDYDSMLEFSYCGAKVLHPRSVEIAKELNVKLQVISSFDNIAGTQIITDQDMELSKIIGIAQNKNIVLVTIYTQLSLNTILIKLSNYDITLQNAFIQNNVIVLINPLEELNKLEKTLHLLQNQNLIENYQFDTNISMLNIIGKRLLNQDSMVAKVLAIIDNTEIRFLQIEHNKISITCNDDQCQELIKKLHIEFLD